MRRVSEDYIKRIHDFIAIGHRIVTSGDISKAVFLSKGTVRQYMPAVLSRYDDIEAINGLGYRKKGVEYSYAISANIYSHDCNDYIYHWDGPMFVRSSSREKAIECWGRWWPPEKEVTEQADIWWKDNPNDTLELEIGLWDFLGHEIEWWNREIGNGTNS